jgi:hypothetical protein
LGVAGGLAGCLSKTAVAPLERVKLLAQNGKVQGLLVPMRQIYQSEGFLAFWRGNNANLLRIIPNRAVMLASNDVIKSKAKQMLPNASPNFVSISGGATSGAVAIAATYPLDLIRGRMGALMESRYSSMWTTTQITMREEGIRGLYRGVGPTVIVALPYEGIKFGVYDLLMRSNPSSSMASSVWWPLVSGGVAGAVGGTFTYPLDTIRRRMQMQGTEAGQVIYRHSFHCCVHMVRHEGIRSLFAGVTANFFRVAPSNAIQFAAYEVLKLMMGFGVEASR